MERLDSQSQAQTPLTTTLKETGRAAFDLSSSQEHRHAALAEYEQVVARQVKLTSRLQEH